MSLNDVNNLPLGTRIEFTGVRPTGPFSATKTGLDAWSFVGLTTDTQALNDQAVATCARIAFARPEATIDVALGA